MKFFDPDFRNQPKTKIFCAACSRDIKGLVYTARVIDDCAVAKNGELVKDAEHDEVRPFGPDCAKRIGLEYFERS